MHSLIVFPRQQVYTHTPATDKYILDLNLHAFPLQYDSSQIWKLQNKQKNEVINESEGIQTDFVIPPLMVPWMPAPWLHDDTETCNKKTNLKLTRKGRVRCHSMLTC